jgi:hypothetical protein
MPYVIMTSGDFSDPERSLINKKWAIRDEDNCVILFKSRQEA